MVNGNPELAATTRQTGTNHADDAQAGPPTGAGGGSS
jgi:hypothetical protein